MPSGMVSTLLNILPSLLLTRTSGVSIIYSMNPLDLSSDPAILDIEERGRIWQISIKKRQNINFQDLLAFVYSNAQKKEKDGAVSKSTEAHQCMIFLNALLRNDPLKRFQTGQGSKSTTYFDQNNSNLRQRLGFNSMLDACSGVYQSASLRFGRLTVNVDIATAIYIQPGAPLIQYVAALCGRDVRPKDLQNYFDRQGPAVTDLILQKLRSIGFRTKHLKRDKMADSYNRYFTDYVFRCNPREDADNYMFNQKITAIGDDGKPYQTFKKTSVTKYYEETYNIKLQYPNLPLVEARGQRGVRWPMELLFIDQAERYKPLLLGEETAEFLKHATSKPSDRLTKIHRNVARLAWHENKDLQNFKVAISAQPIECAARILPTPKITYAENFELDPSRGRWNLRGQHGRAPPQFIKPKALNLWAIVYFSAPGHNSRSPSTQAVELIEQNFARVMRNHGIPTGPLGGIHQMNTQGDFKEVIREIMNQVHAKHGKWPCMLVFILPSDSTQLYGLIKYACEVYIGIASQCLVAPKVNGQKHLDMYLSNVAMKINAKLGGSSANVRDPWFESHPTMILGADMSRPIHTDGGASSFVAVAGSFDTLCQRYTVVTQLQTGEDGIILDFKNMSTILTERYMNRGTAPPKHIIYFRDGISEDRYQTVLEKELKALKGNLTPPFLSLLLMTTPPEFLPKCLVTVIICAKRHHTRLFPTGYGEGDQNGNVLPGTVVENRADGQDIFLVPHVGLQGTVRPTRYISIHDENNLSPDNFQRICNNLSYSYARATCAVSTIPAVYYAGLACSRAKDHLNADGKLQQVNGRLQWSMVYSPLAQPLSAPVNYTNFETVVAVVALNVMAVWFVSILLLFFLISEVIWRRFRFYFLYLMELWSRVYHFRTLIRREEEGSLVDG